MGKKDKTENSPETVNIVELNPFPEGGWGWLVCLAGFTAQFIILGIQNNTGILYTCLLTEFKGRKGDTAWVLSIGLGMMFLFCPIASSLCERVGCRVVAIAGGLLGVLGFVLSSFVKDLYLLYLTFGVLWGIGSSMSYLTTLMMLPFWFKKRVSLANGIVTAGSGIGTIAVGPLMFLLVNKLGWANSVRVLAALVLICAFTSTLYKKPAIDNITTKSAELEAPKKEKKPLFEFSVLKNKAFLVWCVSLSVFMLGYFVPFVHLPGYAMECGVSSEQSSTLVGMMSIGSTFGRLFFGKLCDHPRINRLYVFQIAFLIIGIAHTLMTLTTSYIGFVSYMVVFGIFDGCFVVLLGVLCADIAGIDKVAAGMGVQFFFMAITCTAGPPLAGIVYDISSSYQIAFYASGASATIGCCLLFLVPILMPDPAADEIRMRSNTVTSRDSEKQLLNNTRSPVLSQDSKFDYDNESKDQMAPVITLRSGATRPASIRNSYFDKYWDFPKRASSSSFFGPSAPYGMMPIYPNDETLIVVERISQV
ncbi:monocarboxylate transporter 10-like [Actinia tenebrosa]|uniref:Monocarboxylate transporter 10-like n=1 Tax=Actinia tenebrosa TaxID=6105 RepID=A0A6P8IFQ8_ACTTE|nr:monocarboxylate transporter 10-like [Actinia tenebrosa]